MSSADDSAQYKMKLHNYWLNNFLENKFKKNKKIDQEMKN